MKEHEDTGEQLGELRSLTSGYRPPSNACVSYRAFYKALEELESDIHQHVHLENNVLFPMAERLAAGEKQKA
jgi:regulator of cell morphogenesis and NO signaling